MSISWLPNLHMLLPPINRLQQYIALLTASIKLSKIGRWTWPNRHIPITLPASFIPPQQMSCQPSVVTNLSFPHSSNSSGEHNLAITQLVGVLDANTLNAVVVDHSTILNNFKPHSCRTMVEVMVNVVAISSQVRMKIFYFFSDATSHGVRWVLH